MLFRTLGYGAAVAVLFQITAQAVTVDDKLADALKKASEWTSYKFKSDDTGGKAASSSEGTFEKGKGLHAKGRAEYVLIDGKGASLRNGTWTAAGAGGKKGGGGLPTKYPHEGLAGLDAKLQNVKSAADGDNTVYTGEASGDAAAALLGRAAGGGGAGLTTKGTVKITVNKDGQVVKIELEMSTTGQIKGKDVDFKVNRTTTFSEIGTAKVEIPEEAKKAIGGA